MTVDGKGGCCIGRYATGAYDMSKVDRIMLRFRPIAPKPVTRSSISGGSSSESSDAFSRCVRVKRNYVRENNSSNNNNNNNNYDKRCKRRRMSSSEQKDPVVTLPLLPETPDPKMFPGRHLTVSSTKEVRNNVTKLMWLSFENCASGKVGPLVPNWYCFTRADQLLVMSPPPALRSAGSCVTVECVTESWVDGDGLGSTDEERRVNLSKDTCPGFLSDGFGKVTWTNGSYKKMVGQEEGDPVRVWLVTKEKVVGITGRGMVSYPSFTCRVKLQYTCGKERSSLTVPCDVWRMDSGGFAWRLDVKAALSLSLAR